jgi:hypothetical protein
MAARRAHLIEIDPVERLYHHKQLVSFPDLTEILFLFRHAQSDGKKPPQTVSPEKSSPEEDRETNFAQ